MTPPRHSGAPLRVVVAGGGIAALEAVVALDALAGDRVRPVVVSPSPALVYRPLAVGEPFGLGAPRRYDLRELCDPLGAEIVPDAVAAVVPERRVITTAGGRELAYEALLVAVGAHLPEGERGYDAVLADVAEGVARHVAIVVPEGVGWTLPAYELALLTAGLAHGPGGRAPAVTLVSWEPRPLGAFGASASAGVAQLLAHGRVRFVHGAGAPAGADRVVVLPRPVGPRLPGLPCDADGFVLVDAEGRVPGVPGVLAAGDGTSAPVKQGGLAAQQAARVARHIAALAGAPPAPEPERLVLRGMLRTASGPYYLRAEPADPDGTSTFSSEPLWWPPSKIASRWLAPHLVRIDASRRYGTAVA